MFVQDTMGPRHSLELPSATLVQITKTIRNRSTLGTLKAIYTDHKWTQLHFLQHIQQDAFPVIIDILH